MKKIGLIIGLIVLCNPVWLWAGEVHIEDAQEKKIGDHWIFTVTLKHGDTGWEHYADAWRVMSPDGDELGKRTLFHPHENEQPFTRSLSGVKIPNDIKQVVIEAHDKVHGWSKQQFKLRLK